LVIQIVLSVKLSREQLGELVDRFMRAMHRFDNGRTLAILHAAAVTTPQLAVLEFVHRPRLVSEIAVFCGLSRPATSQLVDKLARARLVSRREGHNDRRQRNVVALPNGRALVERVAAARAARFTASLAGVPPRLARRFSSVLDDVVAALNATTAETMQLRTRSAR
jgi:DNA-binding MarR family transcriptional regulator